MVFSIMMKKKLLFKKIPISRLGGKSHTLFITKIAKMDTLFITKTAENQILWGPHIPIEPV